MIKEADKTMTDNTLMKRTICSSQMNRMLPREESRSSRRAAVNRLSSSALGSELLIQNTTQQQSPEQAKESLSVYVAECLMPIRDPVQMSMFCGDLVRPSW
ncbi:hypothetical protein TNCV_3231301 [Trichonephila clavipes]|nr:hypothetical protein TNCV_3231301 [Trichonephila clavipes]